MFEHLHAAHDALARVVGRRQPSPTGSDPAGGDPPESGKRLKAAILRYNALAACAPAVYQANAARRGIHSEAALRFTEELRGLSPVRFSCNLYFRFFQCIFLIYVYKLKSAVSALFWTVLVSVNQKFL